MNRIACLWFPHLIAEIERKRHQIGEQPLIVYDGERVLECCPQAATAGVQSQAPLRQAMACCPEAQLLPADRDHYGKVWEQITQVLEAHSPLVEELDWGSAYLDARGMGALHGDEAAWCCLMIEEIQRETDLQARVGVAGSRFAAQLAARSASSEGLKLVQEDDRRYLGPLSVDHLPLHQEICYRLHLLGLHTMADLARLSATSVAEQFGAESLSAYRLARGEDCYPLSARRRQILEGHCEWEIPENCHETLLQALLAASREPVTYLTRHGLMIRRVVLDAHLDGGKWLKYSAWVGNTLGPQTCRNTLDRLLYRLERDINGGDDAADIDSESSLAAGGLIEARLQWIGLEPQVGGQLSLFAHVEGRLRLEKSLRKLLQKHSAHCVCRPHAHQPNAHLVKERYELEAFAP